MRRRSHLPHAIQVYLQTNSREGGNISVVCTVPLWEMPDRLSKHTSRGRYVMHTLSAEWLPASVPPPDGDLEICVLAYDGTVHALTFPCHKDGAEWIDASGRKQLGVQPTHWRRWM
jgi:hypothetical protein